MERSGDFAHARLNLEHALRLREADAQAGNPWIGEAEIELSGGKKIKLNAGSVLLAEDLTGQGHISRAVNGQPRRSLFITID